MQTEHDPPQDPQAAQNSSGGIGPFLYLQGTTADHVELSALIVSPTGTPPPSLRTEAGAATATLIRECDGLGAYRYVFSLPMNRDAWYEVDDARYHVNLDFDHDLRVAFVSCNGQEEGDRGRDPAERNALWQRLAQQHSEQPFQLLLHGGDQIYADELAHAHEVTRAWADGKRMSAQADTAEAIAEAADALRQAFFRRYLEVLGEAATSWLMARVPSLAIWDDHDICDGWGSLQEWKLDSPAGQTLFTVARESFLLFQLGADLETLPAICLDPAGDTLGWHARLPNLHVIAPDLRSERRPKRVMGEAGWRAFDQAMAAVDTGRVLLLSSVPALGPRLSWVEAVMHLTSRMEKYEDDLRDQWQSRTHRAEWRRFLERLAEVHANAATPITLLSGEIHLATRGTFDVPPGPMHQFVASGITHPKPPLAYAIGLGLLARLGETPVPGHPIRLHPLPGKRAIYTAQRNYLILERHGGNWSAWWELERDGPTPAIDI